jgi:hypothetical protein
VMGSIIKPLMVISISITGPPARVIDFA